MFLRMAAIKRSKGRSWAIRDADDVKFDNHASPEFALNNSGSALLRAQSKAKIRSANSNYVSNSRSGVYAVDEEFHKRRFEARRSEVIRFRTFVHK